MRLAAGEIVIGRSSTCAVVLADESLSRRHASISVGSAGVVVRDLGSTNGTFVEGGRIRGEVKLAAGARVEIGDTLLRLEQLTHEELDTALKLYESSSRDFETGVYNARHFEERLANELAFTIRHRTPLSLAFIEVDDAATPMESRLRDVAVVICNAIRTEDFVARVSGRAFALLLRETERRGANILAERIRHLVRRSSGDEHTVSIGLATYEATTHFQSADALLSAAREATARARLAGGDVVIQHEAAGSLPPSAR
jgi:diguanylate cyclase (GGDEF)-like protein